MVNWPWGKGGAGAPTPEAPAAPELDPQAKIDAMLNNRKFVDYLQEWSEHNGRSVEDITVAESGAGEMEKQFENFQNISKVTEKVRGVLNNEIAAAAKVSLGDEELKCVDKYLNEKGIKEGIESLSKIEAEVDRFVAQKEQVAKLSAEIKEQTKNYVEVEGETVHKQEAGIRLASQVSRFKRVTGWFLKPKEAQDLRYAEVAGVNTKHLRRTQAQVDREVATDKLQQANLEGQQSAIKDARFALIELFNDSTDLVTLINAKVAEKLAGVVETGSEHDLDTARKTYGEIDERFTDGLDEEWKVGLDKALEDKIGEQIRETMANLGEQTNLSAMEGRLTKFFERRTKGFGFKEDEDIVRFIAKTFSDIYRTPNQLDFSKKLLLRRVCTKNGINLEDHANLSDPLPEPEVVQPEPKEKPETVIDEVADAYADAERVQKEAAKVSELRQKHGKDKTPGVNSSDYDQADINVEAQKSKRKKKKEPTPAPEPEPTPASTPPPQPTPPSQPPVDPEQGR